MNWKEIKDFFADLFEPDIVNDFVDDGNPYELIPEERDFLESSVKGDYRLYPLKNGFIASWGKKLSARNYDGKLLWTLDSWADALAVDPDGLLFAACHGNRLCLFDCKDANQLCEVVELNSYIDFIVWLDRDRFAASDGMDIYIFSRQAVQIDLLEGAVPEDGFLGGIAADPGNNAFITILDVNEHQLKKIDLKKRQLIRERDVDFAEQLLSDPKQPWIWTTVVNGSELKEIRMYDSKNLRERVAIVFNGKKGVRPLTHTPNDLSYHSFISLPSLSPRRQYFLVNDNSGMLWLIDAGTGDKRRIFRRNLLDFVLHTLWIDEEHFISMLDGGYVAKMSIRGRKLIWKEKDVL
jgi:hypothetical protein